MKIKVAYFMGKYPAKFQVKEFTNEKEAKIFVKNIKEKGGKTNINKENQ